MQNKIIPYNPKLRQYARQLRNNSTATEIILWKNIRKRAYGVQFHRQVPLLDYIVDFYCHEIMLAIEVDGTIHEYKYQYDKRRQERLEERGIRFLRFTNTEIRNELFSVLLAIQQRVEELKANIDTPAALALKGT